MCLVGSRNDNGGMGGESCGGGGAEQNGKSEGRNQMAEALGTLKRAVVSALYRAQGAVEAETPSQQSTRQSQCTAELAHGRARGGEE